MSNSETRQFIQDALLRYDPEIDLSEGSRADTELVQPIVQRIGIDPFDDDILTFVRTRVQQAFPNLAITEDDPLTDTIIDPMRVLIEPLVREVKLAKLRSSLRNLNSLSDDEVDALMGNFFVARITGGYSVGVVRIYFATPQSVSLTMTNPATTRAGLRFMPTRPQAITADQMILNREGSEYYFDVNYTAENRGDEYNIETGEIVSIANLPTATRIRNPRRFRGGTPRETSVDFAARAQRSTSDKTLTVDRGIVATLSESFPTIRRIFSVGFRDPEMQRDVVRGGNLGPIPANDVDGAFYGSGTVVDDLDGDLLSPLVDAPTGFFVSRLGPAGSEPEGWFLTITYTIGGTVTMFDAAVLEVVSSTQVRIDREMPVATPAVSVVWVLRQKTLSISEIPGGIVLPDSASGTLEIRRDEVHIGGKTDVYIAGETELATAQIDSLTDEEPSARGTNAQTQGLTPGSEDLVILNDAASGVVAGYSLVLEEGVDAGSYRILELVSAGPLVVRIDTDLTGSQGSLAWKVVDEIDVELTDPKDIKVTGADMVTAAGNDTVTTSSATNFIDANVQEGDILELEDEDFGGEFSIEEVSAVSLKVSPAPARTFTAIAYRIFRRSEAVDPPLVRIQSMEILDSTGAPSGTRIPYRDPVLALSNAFQNEGSGYAFEGLCRIGMVTAGIATGGTYLVGSQTIDWAVYNKDAVWSTPINAGTFTFTAGSKTAAQIVAEINADFLLDRMGVKARVITVLDRDYVGIVSSSLVEFSGGTALAPLGWAAGVRNNMIRSDDLNNLFTDAGVRPGDVVEIVEGTSAGIKGRVVIGPIEQAGFDLLAVGSGPIGPEAVGGLPGLYNNTVLNPDVNALVRIGRASVGSARVYFLDPTAAEFDYRTTVFGASVPTASLEFRPDPENLRVVRPPPPLTELPNTGTTASGSPDTLTDTDANFLLYGIQPGDLLDVLYIPIVGTSALPLSGNIAFTGLNNVLRLRLDTDPFITISFPFQMPRQDAVDFINEQVGEDVASLTSGGELQFRSSRRIELDPTSTVITHGSDPLSLAGLGSFTSDHPDKGTYIIRSVAETVLTLSDRTQASMSDGTTADTSYRIRRYVQRISPTEMNAQIEASGLYYADVQLVSLTPGDVNNIGSGVALEIEGVRSDGYRLVTENAVTSFSRAEVLHAELSRSILLVGSADDPAEAVQLSQQNVQVTYERSQLVDEVQSFTDSDFQRVICQEILVRHLLPHYVSMTWNYSGGSSEPDMLRAVQDLLDGVEPDEQLEVTDLTDVLRRRSATSVFTPDSSSSTGRSAPFFVVVYHNEERQIRALIVKDYVTTVRTQRYIPDNITLTRLSTGGIR